HSHEEVLYALLKMAHERGIPRIIVHAFLDGRDVPIRSAEKYLNRFDAVIKDIPTASLGTIQGRSFPMDRTNNLGTVSKAFATLTDPQPAQFHSWKDAFKYYYDKNITDEFIPPTTLL